MATESRHRRLAEAGSRGGKASLESMTAEERSARARAAAEARWSKTKERVVSKMVSEIYRLRRPMALYRRDSALWFAPPGGYEARRWERYLVGTYDVGVIEEDVMADVNVE
jgi:hypothetical protein